MYILGIWDGHDSGAVLIHNDLIIFAANEERYTKRKLEVSFPSNSIKAALEFAQIKPAEVNVVAFPTAEFTKTISRIFPWQKESYYRFRRRKMLKPRHESLMRFTKYSMTTIGVLPGCRVISKGAIRRELRHLGFENPELYCANHHASHAATAAYTSGFKRAAVITMDGLGDGESCTISDFSDGRLEKRHSISARNSIGVFYEQATNIVGMRELEDEGKVMAMAEYSYPFTFEENKLKDFFSIKGTEITAKYGPVRQYDMLNRLAWSMPREQFSYMVQQLLEHVAVELVRNYSEESGSRSFAFAGGIMSNVKLNMRIKDLDVVKEHFVFPHMGDGGIALGAAMVANHELNGISSYDFRDAYLGNSYSDEQILESLRQNGRLKYEIDADKHSHAAEIIGDGEYLFWFQDRMEYGPRALGNRSILASADSSSAKDMLNIYVKHREWYQPFAPSMLEEEAVKALEGVKSRDRFMTTAYKVKGAYAEQMRSVVHIDMTARPQMLGNENRSYRALIEALKKKTGCGVVLNTSFNIHGMPIVLSPADAIETMEKTKTRYMFIGDYFVENKAAKK